LLAGFCRGARIDPVKATFRRIDSRQPAGDRKAGGGSSHLEKAREREDKREGTMIGKR